MKKLFSLLIGTALLFFAVSTMAQTTYEDVVHLKNGSIIHGLIIEQIPNQSIKIQTKDGNIFVYKTDEIEKITKEQTQNSKSSNNFSDNEIKQSGFSNITEINLGIGVGSTFKGGYSFGIQNISGYLVNPYICVGMGIGVDKYLGYTFNDYKNGTFMPIFADVRVNFIKGKVTPFFSGDIGYSLGFNGISGGPLINPSLGVKFFVSPNTALNFSIGYRIQLFTYDKTNSYWDYLGYYNSYTETIKETATYLNFKFGVTF